MNNQPTTTEQVLTDYVIENANLKLRIKELEQRVHKLEKEEDHAQSISKD